MKTSRTRSQATKDPRVSASYSEFQCKREATSTTSCSLMRRRRERDGWVTGPSTVQGVTNGLDLLSTKWSGGAALARVKQKHVPAGGHGDECTSKSYWTHLWNSYSKVLQGVGRTQQTGCTSGMNEASRRVFAPVAQRVALVFQIHI